MVGLRGWQAQAELRGFLLGLGELLVFNICIACIHVSPRTGPALSKGEREESMCAV